MKRLLLPLLLICLLLSGCFLCPHRNVSAATCTEDGICQLCEDVITPATGHTEAEFVCQQDTLCTVCGVVLKSAVPHQPGPESTCTEKQACLVCGEPLAELAEHTPSGEPSCTEDVVCTECAAVLIPAAHEPGPEANCTDDQICLRCGAVLAPFTGHTAQGNLCGTCGVTMAIDENSPPGSYIHETVNTGHYTDYGYAYYSGNVLVCGDYALEYFNLSSSGNSTWADALNIFADRFPEVQVSAMLVPKSCAYNSPIGFTDSGISHRAYIEATFDMLDDNVIGVNVMDVMDQHKGEYMYYRTDHHWTSLGAYYASVAFCRANGIIPRPLSSYETSIQGDYIGSMYYFCDGYEYSLLTNPDYTVYHMPDCEYSMTIGVDGYSALVLNPNTNDYAGGFISSDNALSVITTDNQTGRNLIMFKESFGNCYAPFMADYFDTVIVVDMRYFDGSLSYLVEEFDITHALVMNNSIAVDSFAETLWYVLQY